MDTEFVEYYNDLTIKIVDDYHYGMKPLEYQNTKHKHNYMYEYYYLEEYHIYSDGFTSQHGIIVEELDGTINSAIVLANGVPTSVHKKSYHIENNSIMICCGDVLFSLALPDLRLIWKTKIDIGRAIAIYKMNNDYIIEGEIGVSRINSFGKIIWERESLYTSTKNAWINEFKIIGKYIFTRSWDERKIQYDFNGNKYRNIFGIMFKK